MQTRILALHFGEYLRSLLCHVPQDEAFRRQAFELMRAKLQHDAEAGRPSAASIGEIVAACAVKLRARRHRPGPERWYALSSALIRAVHDRDALACFAEAWKDGLAYQVRNALRFGGYVANDLLNRIEGMDALGTPLPITVREAYLETAGTIARHLAGQALALTALGKRFRGLMRKTCRLLWRITRTDHNPVRQLAAGEAVARLRKALPARPRRSKSSSDIQAVPRSWPARAAVAIGLN